MNHTHQALLINRDGTDASIIAAGPRRFCALHAKGWADEHPLKDGMSLIIVKVLEVISEGSER